MTCRKVAHTPEVISPAEEDRFLAEIAPLPFKEFQFHGFEGKRRVVSFGWLYDFSESKALPADPFPPFLLEVFHTIHGVTGFEVPDAEHVLVTEYAPDASIVDRPVFGNVMGLSLGSACTFRLRKSDFSDDAAGRLC